MAATLITRVLLVGGGAGSRFVEVSTCAAFAGILSVLHVLGKVLERGITAPKFAPQLCVSSTWVGAPMGGLFCLARIGYCKKADSAPEDHPAQLTDGPMFDEDEVI